jgi:hypothetical protein
VHPFYKMCLVMAVVAYPVLMWRKLGDPTYLETWHPDALRWIGAKLVKGKNGRTYAEPPPPLKRLQLSLLLGLVLAVLLGCFFKWVMPD